MNIAKLKEEHWNSIKHDPSCCPDCGLICNKFEERDRGTFPDKNNNNWPSRKEDFFRYMTGHREFMHVGIRQRKWGGIAKLKDSDQAKLWDWDIEPSQNQVREAYKEMITNIWRSQLITLTHHQSKSLQHKKVPTTSYLRG